MIKYIKGDATAPIGDGVKIIVHVCNNIGAWGAGFVLALSKKWSEPERRYKQMNKVFNGIDLDTIPYVLGDYEIVRVDVDISVANIIGQEGVGVKPNQPPPIRYYAVHHALKDIATHAKLLNGSIHMPRIGCGLAGGDWTIMEAVIKSAVPDDVPVIVYDFE